MKKILISVACLVFSVVLVQGQVKFGPIIGLNLSNVTGGLTNYSENSVSKAGLRLGVMADVSLSDHFSIAPELSFSQKGYKTGDIKTNINYIQVPVNLAYHLNLLDDFGVFVNAGPYFGYAVSGKVEDIDIEFGSGDTDMKALDLGVGFGAGAEIGPLVVKLQYETGLTNVSNYSGGDAIKNTNICASVAYLFGD